MMNDKLFLVEHILLWLKEGTPFDSCFYYPELSTINPPVFNIKVKMSSDFEAYEQDFGTITAEITNKIGRIPKLSGGKTVKYIS